MPKIILISGKAQSGKDTFAQIFKDNAETQGKKVLIIRYGDIVKFVCKEYLGWDGNKDLAGRTLLQTIGTDVGRKKDPNVWVNCIMNIVNAISSLYDYVLIPDVRFENEITKWINLSFDYITVRINRVNADNTPFDNGLSYKQKNHISETSLDNYVFDYYITNRKLFDFGREVIDIYNELEMF